MYVCGQVHTIICSYSVRTGAINRTPTPTECMLRLFMYNQCLFHEHVKFTHVHPLWCVIAFIQFGVNGRDESDPTPTECALRIVYVQPMFIPRVHNICPNITLRIVLVHQRLPTCIHCDAWLHLYNSVWTGAMNRTLRLRNVRCGLFMYNQCLFHEHVIFTHVHQRLHHVHPLWCVIAFIQFGMDGRDESAPTPTECTLRIVHVHQRLPTCTHCRGRFIVPAYYGIHGVGISLFH